MLWFRRKKDDVLLVLRAENSDLRQTLRSEREAWAVERQELIDRIVALANPAILRELRRDAVAAQPTERPSPQHAAKEWRPNFPGVDEPYKDPPKREGQGVLDEIVANLRAERDGRN